MEWKWKIRVCRTWKNSKVRLGLKAYIVESHFLKAEYSMGIMFRNINVVALFAAEVSKDTEKKEMNSEYS